MAPKPVTFYDIASNEPLRTFAANPWKTRLALNYKGVDYQTQWVEMPDIHAEREKLGVPANRTNPDGTPYHTLPVIQDASTGTLLGDSFEIAQYLDKAYPDAPSLFRPLTTGLTAAFNAQVDGIFTKYAILCSVMPFDPCVAAAVGAMFAKRAESMNLKDLQLTDEMREAKLVAFQASLGELVKSYRHTGGTTDYFWSATGTAEEQKQRAPAGREQGCVWLDGDSPAYGDFIVGAWLKMFEATMPSEDWQRVRTWQGGFWGELVDALSTWSEIK